MSLYHQQFRNEVAKLPNRSNSSPSPPHVSANARTRTDQAGRKQSLVNRNAGQRRGRPAPLNTQGALGNGNMSVAEWSSSYQAGSSSSGSGESTEEYDTDDERRRGRTLGPLRGSLDSQPCSTALNNSTTTGRRSSSLTRSRSPAFPASLQTRPGSPSWFQHTTSRRTGGANAGKGKCFLPATFDLSVRLPLGSGLVAKFSIDTRKAAEGALLVGSLAYVTEILEGYAKDGIYEGMDGWIPYELSILLVISFTYVIWTQMSYTKIPKPTKSPPPSASSDNNPMQRTSSPRPPETFHHSRRISLVAANNLAAKKDDFGFVWMTVPKNYRDSTDDGILTALLLGPLVASAMLCSSVRSVASSVTSSSTLLPPSWRIEPPYTSPDSPYDAREALVRSRLNLVDLATVCSAVLLVHVLSSWWSEARARRALKEKVEESSSSGSSGIGALEGERASVPRSEGRRTWAYVCFVFAVTLGALVVKSLLVDAGSGVWKHMNYLEIAIGALFYQFALYVSIRLAHRGFTLGELGATAFCATALFMEMVNITLARMWPATAPFIKTYRLPNPILIYQMTFIPGSLLTGFLLCPLLILSRHIAQQSVRRIRVRQERLAHRRGLAAGFYLGSLIIVLGPIGLWTKWCLGGRDPWWWAAVWLFEGEGGRRWTRLGLLGYWAALVGVSVAGWNRQLARLRRWRGVGGHSHSHGQGESIGMGSGTFVVPYGTAGEQQGGANVGLGSGVGGAGSGSGMVAAADVLVHPTGNGSGSPVGGMTGVATDLLDAADKRVPTLSLNARRKFFHALAVAMFLPGVAVDPAFAHLSFSAAFALFTFAEYVRYFALYPFGALVHVFMNDFLDHKDGGTAILSHFYLLTGCAGSVWLEGSKRYLLYTGILTLGVGDAVASIVGKRIGRHRWSPTTPKTLEGSAAFTLAVSACAVALRLCGLAEPFSTARYVTVAGLASLLEALSLQNDNLTLPLYTWSMLVAADV